MTLIAAAEPKLFSQVASGPVGLRGAALGLNLGSMWRRLDPRQALLVLAHLRCGDTYARLAGAFQVSITTVFRYIREVVDLLARPRLPCGR
jgi:DDE superfamily endonuclease